MYPSYGKLTGRPLLCGGANTNFDTWVYSNECLAYSYPGVSGGWQLASVLGTERARAAMAQLDQDTVLVTGIYDSYSPLR